jgi:hypothetical protein
MATLHVRNVPDGLYERLRECAAANGRSIGAEVVVLIEREVAPGEGRRSRIVHRSVPRRRAKKPFQHFGTRARQVVVAARTEAMELGAAGIGTEHLLLALLQPPRTVATPILERAGLDHAGVRRLVEAASSAAEPQPAEGLPFTPETKKALELALRESIDLHCVEIAPEHLLLGIARAGEGQGARILVEAGLDPRALTGELRAVDPPLLVSPDRPAGYGFKVVELTGEADDWERRLNSLAAAGYELVEIVDRRAIFRTPTFG